MKHLRRIAYSVAAGVLVTLLSFLLDRVGGELLAVPGMIAAGMVDLAASLMSGPDEYPQILSWEYYSVAFYSLLFYGASWAVTATMAKRKKANSR